MIIIAHYYHLQTNVLVFSWVKDGHFSSTGELIALPLLVVFMVFTSVLGWAAVSI